MIQVKIFYAHNELRNFSYLILDKDTGRSWVIDPFDEKPIIEYIKKESLTLTGILNTHKHWDHVQGNPGLQLCFNCPVLSETDQQIQLPDKHLIKFIRTPGHTKEHLAFSWQKGDTLLGLFSGDTLFNSGVGNCRGGGDVSDLFETTKRLRGLPDDVVLYPGHDYVLKNLQFAKSVEPENREIDEALKLVGASETEAGINWTLGQERKVNPFFRLNSLELREKVMHDQNSEDQKSLFVKLRSLRDNW